MLIVSAGVIMNIILAAVAFMGVFLYGFAAPPAVVGQVLTDSPAGKAVRADGTRAPIRPGDRILKIDDHTQHDFTKVALTVALVGDNTPVPVVVQRDDGTTETLRVVPGRPEGDGKGLLQLGISPAAELRGVDPKMVTEAAKDTSMVSPDLLAVPPGSTVIAVNDKPVDDPIHHAYLLDRAVDASDGTPVKLTVRDADGKISTVEIRPRFQRPFGIGNLSIAGFIPRIEVEMVTEKSPARGKIKPGDVVVAVTQGHDTLTDPSGTQFREWIRRAGEGGIAESVAVQGTDGKLRTEAGLLPISAGEGAYQLGILLDYDSRSTVVADVAPDSPAKAAGILPGSIVRSINGAAVSNWFQVRRQLQEAVPGKPVAIVADVPTPLGVEQRTYAMTLTAEQAQAVNLTFLTSRTLLHDRVDLRKTKNPWEAFVWGVTETRDFVLQNYLTIRRMVDGTISPRNAMGPVGIFQAGAGFADRGFEWLVWFLAVISANLAVVNFLPIPIVDGGLFAFLVLEKIQGRPLSQNTQKIIQVVGLALILGVFLMVTYNDIARIFTGRV
jgi:regulator of sigma E protease